MKAKVDIRCMRCRREPHEIPEYVEMGNVEKMTPVEFVKQEEGTYNPKDGAFACTECYLAMGAPSRRAPKRWIAHHGLRVVVDQ